VARRRTRNPSNFETGLIAIGTGFVGMLAGFWMGKMAIEKLTLTSPLNEAAPKWRYWVSEDRQGYIPYIQSPKGDTFELDPEFTDYSARQSAQNAIRQRGGDPVEGKPI
jgi:hypothetical protein